MSSTDESDASEAALEHRILQQLNETIRRRQELEAEENSLRRLLVKVRNETLKSKDVTRKNSVNRILVEDRILDMLARSKQGVSAANLGREALYFFPNLKPATFRSYLHRLSTRGVIEPAPGRMATWRLTERGSGGKLEEASKL
jgi:predicted transcriptional regulator